MSAGRNSHHDLELITALACGASLEAAARKAGLSVRTVQRRRRDPAFRAEVERLRAEILQRSAGMLNAGTLGAIKTLTHLHESAQSESVRLQAARAVIELSCKLRDAADTDQRLAAVEAQLQQLLTLLKPQAGAVHVAAASMHQESA